MTRALAALVHDGATAERALEQAAAGG
jgi:hypothetical protein